MRPPGDRAALRRAHEEDDGARAAGPRHTQQGPRSTHTHAGEPIGGNLDYIKRVETTRKFILYIVIFGSSNAISGDGHKKVEETGKYI